MAKVSTKEFIDLVSRSRLVEEDRLAKVVQQCKEKHGGKLPSPEECSEDFIVAGIISGWHSNKLLNGKYKGFFLGKYKLLDHLGTGGMSSVYLAEHTLMQQLRAVKVLPKRRVNDTSYLARFYREAKAAAALDHPNIVRAYDIDEESGNHFIVMEFVEGRDLQQMVKQDGPLSFTVAANFIAQAAAGLQHAHDANLIHRDIKPANLLVDPRNTVKVLDMGLARFTNDEQNSLTVEHDENVLGTADYLSPEQAKNSHLVDGRADIYSLGCTLYFMLTGHAPFNTGTLAQRIAAHQTEMPPGIGVDRPDVPPELEKICQKMMRKMPRRRYQSASEVEAALQDWITSQSEASAGKAAQKVAASATKERLSAAKAKPPPPRPRPSSGGSGSAPRKPRNKPSRPSQSLQDTHSGEGQMTKKGMGSNSGSKRIRTAKSLDELQQINDSGAIDLGIETVRPGEGSGKNRQTPSILDARRKRSASKKPLPLWLWIAIGGLLIVMVILMFLIFGAPPKEESPDPQSDQQNQEQNQQDPVEQEEEKQDPDELEEESQDPTEENSE